MNTIKYFFSIVLLFTITVGCQKENYDDISFINSASPSGKLTALFDITQDNTGLVTITPNGEGVTTYDIYYGHGAATPVKVAPGKSTQHVYPEGVYTVKIVGYNAKGETTEATQQLTVSFKAPENLEVTAVIDAANNFKVNVSAKALYETLFKVYYGDGGVNEVPVSFLEGETVSHTYASVGSYTLKVEALSGGAAKTVFTKVIIITDPVLLPITFQSTTVDYSFNNFAGGVVTVINNTQPNGINTSTRVGKMVKNSGETYGGSLIKLGENIDFSANKVFRMKVYSPRVGAKVLLKVENAVDGTIQFEKEVLTTKANEWEDLVFDYRAINLGAGRTYNNIVLIFDNGTRGDGSANFTWLFDDIRLTNQIPTSVLSLPVTFDQAGVNYAVTDFGNASTLEAVADPAGGANKVAKTTKPTGAEPWAGTTIGSYFNAKIPFTATQTQMSVRVYSPAAGIKVRLKVEDHTNNTKSVETESVTTVANNWETLIFDFSTPSVGTASINLANNYDMASIFFDFLKTANGKVFYWDDVTFLTTNVTPEHLGIPIDFQSTKFTYEFGDFAGGVVTLVNNPSASGINTSSKVAKMVKNAGEVYGGSTITLTNSINFSVKKIVKVKVFSPRVGAKLLFKVENSLNGGSNFEREVTTTTANAWEELTFDFSAIPGGTYDKVVWIFDLGTMGNGTANFTYYFDDITLN
ncbi:hypothetical protein [Pedobacter cryophilus]|uniref:PKD/Chitinase domain-containing protein n=1 Tax=Pedobacter cryophilus TaxID=2571271 RepID=A0A4V5NZM6_9SPHI|nr:hypothetical protein [Pedobacter cryophilus]TKC00621.1 hypothetical protein FA046_02775 [Pedobacter cryophilus]